MGETGQKGAGLTWVENLEWLSPEESDQLQNLRFEKRRSEWMMGRMTAKTLLTNCLDAYRGVALPRITIANRADGSPYVLLDGQRQSLSISLSHRQGMAVAAVCQDVTIRPGIDLEWIEERDASFYEDYFTREENRLLGVFPGGERAQWGTLIWSAKESGLKALGQGLRVDTRFIQVLRIGNVVENGWRRMDLQTNDHPIQSWQGWWRKLGNHILTLAVLSFQTRIEIRQILPVGESGT